MRSIALPLFLFAAAAMAFAADATLPAPAKKKIDYKEHIQPILASKCYSCHGAKQQQSGLRLDKRQNALRGGDYGPVILPGDSAHSKLILRVVTGDGGMKMPPAGPLEVDEIATLRAWIDQGADFGDADLKEEKPRPVDPKVRELISMVRARDEKGVEKALRASGSIVNGRDGGGSSALHHAAAFGTIATMKALLDKGAEVDAKNRFGQTPLHWAFSDREKTALLLDRGAKIDGKANDGRTALYLAASQRNTDAVLRLLLDRGAAVDAVTTNGRTALMAAASGGMVDYMKMLLAKKANVNAVSGTGSVALMDAASSRNVEALRLLINAGANVNARTKRNQTALAMASMYGSEDMVKALLDKGADVNVRDERGYSALMYAAYSEVLPAGIVRMLLAKGADTNVSGEGETPVSLAAKRGNTEVAKLLKVPASAFPKTPIEPNAASAERQPAEAIRKATMVLASQSPTFIRKAGCNSCHNQNLPSAARAMARDRGLTTVGPIAELPLELAEKYPERAMDMTVANIGSLGYELFAFGINRRPADEYTDAVVHYVKAMQTPEGSWQTMNSRPPLTSDDVITTAMAVNILRTYAPARDKAETDRRLERAAKWLAAVNPVTTQERAFQVLGLAWTKAPAAAVERAMKSLVETQRADGGWSQLASMGSDAYATGEALYAMNVGGGMAVSDATYRKGVRYLLSTQANDGSWHVRTRSLPLQPYFESGFPYHHDQWISSAGTAWASMALSLTVDAPRVSRNYQSK